VSIAGSTGSNCRWTPSAGWLDKHGDTDIDRMAPVCTRHHSLIHANGWTLHLAPDRSLTIRDKHGGTIMTTGPPSEQWQ
jgi:hypothetical protein